ncbi:porin [Paraburkholderia hayleyella]|uniref:porin n=1 Tax=Paraburkholderia hayleyella TaxID=2152889 RepID=UPI00129248B4|nr:porin [Paraburkholderia hayleyella]
MRKRGRVVASAAGLLAGIAHAQSGVTLYGVVDSGITYQSSQTKLGSTTGGKANVRTTTGSWAGNRFGLKGAEDLGGGTKVIFQLESGFNLNTGEHQYNQALFGRQAWVGLTHPAYGTLTAGRQYTSYYSLLSAYSPTNWLTGFYGAHPGDIDGLDSLYRTNNALVYTSPKLYGFTVSGSYAFAGIPGSVSQGSTWSGAIQYTNGPAGIAAGLTRSNNATPGGGVYSAASTTHSGGQPGLSALTNGYQSAQAQQRFAVTAGYKFSSTWDMALSYSNVQYIPGVASKYTDTAIFNTAGAVLHWKPDVAWDFATGYSYTWATQANGIKNAAQYHQVTLSEYYTLSKRTGLYALQGFQRANGQTLGTAGAGKIIGATATIGDGFQSAPASSASQFAASVGIVHRF